MGTNSKKYILLYHACSANAPLHVFALFLPQGQVNLHIVDPATRRQPIPRLQEQYVNQLRQFREQYDEPKSYAYPEALDFSTAYHSSDITAMKAISRELGLLEDKSYTVVISSSKDDSYFDQHLPKLSKFPTLSMPKARAPHTLDVFPWQTHVTSKLMTRFLTMGSWIGRLVTLADYYDIPMGHIEGDQPLYCIDVNFARRLTQQDIVLWWSPGERPDLGGIENDTRLSEEFPETEFMKPGVYSNVCLEVTLRNLAVNSVLQSQLVNELEGSGGSTAFDSVSHTLDEYSKAEGQRDLTLAESQISPQNFAIIRSLLKGWLLDKIRDEFESPATLAVDHFWRWASSSASGLYDPTIHRFIHGLMRKTFIQLIAEFKRLGATIVYADFSNILLATSKPPGTAFAYATYITTAVTSNELFQHIYLNTERFYDFLIFMDRANLAAVHCEDPLATEPSDRLSLEMRWNIQQFLPPAVQDDFALIVQYYLVELFKIKQKSNEIARKPLRILENGAPDNTQRDAAKASETEGIADFIAHRLTRKMLKTVGSVQERYHESMLDDEIAKSFEFPTLPGGYLRFENPPLEFIKSVCEVFSLAKAFDVEIRLMKRNLLEVVGVREFANEATFKDPCEPLKLSNMPCSHCDALRDFDFCRDPDLAASSQTTAPRWYCSSCNGEYDRVAIEFMLIGIVHTIEANFSGQDLRCPKCKQIRSDNLSRHCQCSGSYLFTSSKVDARRKLRTMVNIAIFYNLPRLKVSTQCSDISCRR
jgi:DNA polymerase epsilon subunit 1